ncbi:MAG TPA: S41 family peptidase [Pseudomonadales bacterium]
MLRSVSILLHTALGLACLLASTAWAADEAPITEDPQAQLPLKELRMFVDAFEQIRSHYVEEVDDQTLLKYAIEGMLSGLDPHSAFLDTADFTDLQDSTSGEFGGLGMEVGMEDGLIRVIAPIDDTPAQRAGIESGDFIIRIDGQSITGMNLDSAVDMMRGKPGSKISITVLREGVDQPFELTLTRAIIRVHSVRSETLEPGFGYIRIASFQEKTGSEIDEAIGTLKATNKPLKGIVLDLRNNPGGLLQSSVQVVDAFLSEGLVVYTEGRQPDSVMRFEASGTDLSDGVPLVVLINNGSASASEIVAGALQDHHRAIIMGTRSFGKGSVQTVLQLSDDQAIKLTTALYFTPSGRSIQAQGIEPDITVQRARITNIENTAALSLSEADLKGHLGNGNGKADAKPAANEKAGSLQERDNQLYEALTLLKGLNILARPAAQ